MYAQIDVELSPVDLHSGMYGGVVDNPANALAGDHRRAQGPRRPRSGSPASTTTSCRSRAEEREAMAALQFDEEAFRAGIPVTGARGRGGLDGDRAQGRPPDPRRQRDVGRVPGRGRQDDHPRPCARQGLDPPGGEPGRRSECSRRSATTSPRSRRPGVTVRTTLIHGGEPSLTPIDHPATLAAARSIRAVFGVDPVYMREGGSIPVTAAFDHTLGLPVVLLGFMQPDLQRPRAQRVARRRQLRARDAGHRAPVGRAGQPLELSSCRVLAGRPSGGSSTRGPGTFGARHGGRSGGCVRDSRC